MTEKKRTYAVARGVPNRIVVGGPQVLVLVGGTVDPFNFWEDINLSPDQEYATHSRGYSTAGQNKKDPHYWARAAEDAPDTHDANWYWETNPRLRAKLEELKELIPNLHVFTMHGWSGDNALRNREIAGVYLCNRLCGGGGEKPYYPKWRDRPVSFHLMGHSHGGNVVSEFTRRAASCPEWPKTWKIRSISYLSTPFFKRLHPVDTGAFHADCTILNVFNKYDLTQRVVADFNLQHLNGVLALANASAISKKIKEITFEGKLLWALTPAGVQDFDPSWLGVDLRVVMDPAKGAGLYRECLRCFEQLDVIFADVHAMIGRLHSGVAFPLAIQFVDRMCAGREVVSAALAQRFHREIDQLRSGLAIARRAMNTRVASGKYPVMGFFDDLHLLDFVEPFVAFLEIDKATFRGPLADLLHELVKEQIEVFDNTTHRPDDKLKGTSFASKIRAFEVTRHDLYMEPTAKDYRSHFDSFIKRLEAIEERYDRAPSQKDLLDVVFTVGGQVPLIREFLVEWLTVGQWIDGSVQVAAWQAQLDNWVEGEQVNRFVVLLHRLARALLNYAELLGERDVGALEVPRAVLPPKRNSGPHPDPNVGSLNHFMRVSHSVSRDDLYPDVRAALLEQLLPPRQRR